MTAAERRRGTVVTVGRQRYAMSEWVGGHYWVNITYDEGYVYNWATRCDLHVERHGKRYTFYQGPHMERTLGTYTLKEAVAFIDGYYEAKRFYVG